MKRFFLALLLLICTTAHAQVERPPCYPLVNGVHTSAPRHFIGEQGQHVFWFCSARGGTSLAYGFSCLHGQCSMAALHAAHTTILAATAKVTAANSQWDAHMQFHCPAVLAEQTDRGRLCREREGFLKVLGAGR